MEEVTEEDLRQHFASLDNGNKGYLDEADLANLVPPGDQQQDAVMRLMDQLDADKDGRVSFADFCMGYGAGMTGKEAAGDDEPDANIAMNEIHVVSDEVYGVRDELSTSPDAAQTQRVVFRHKRFGRRSVPSSSSDITEGIGCLLKPPDEQNTDIQILSPVTTSPSDSRPSSSQEHYPDLASQMESFYQPPVYYDRSRRNSKVLSWINDSKDVFEDTGTEHRSSTFPRTQNVPSVVEAVEKKNYSVEITKGDVSLMCRHSGGEEETEELMELFDKLDHQKNGKLKLEMFIAGVQSQQLYAANVTSTPPPLTVGWGPKPIHMPPLDQSFGTPLPAKSKHPYASVSTPRQATPLPPTEVPLGNVPLTSFGSDKSNYVTADELASTWHKLGIDATDEEVENFIEKLPADQSGYISIPELSASIESALVMDETDHGSKKIALLSIKHEISSLRSQVMHLSMERDKLKADTSQMLETSRRIVKEGDDIAFEIQNIREAEKREIEKKYEDKLKDQNRSWSREIERMSEECNQKVVELELLKKHHQDEIEAFKSDLQDAKVAKEQFEKAFEKVQVELAEEQRARKALQRDLSCHPESTDYDVIESLRERIRELEKSGATDSEEVKQLKEENKELVDKNDELQSEHEKLKQMYFHEQRKSQRMKARLQALGRRSNHSRKPSKDLTKSTDTTQPPVNSAPRFNQPHKLSTDFTDNNTQPPPVNDIFGEEEEDFRSESATLLEELTEQEKHQTALDRIAELEEKNSNLEAKLSDLESTNTELTSANKLLEKELADSVEKEKITSHRLGQDLTKERQYGHTMSMRVDMLSNENIELTERLTKLQNEMAATKAQHKHQHNEFEDRITLLNNTIRVQQSEAENQVNGLTQKHRAEMHKLQETFSQEKELLNSEIAELKNDLELVQQELEDKTTTLNNAVDVMRAESEEKDIRLSEEKELHESVIEKIQAEHEKALEMLTADLEDAQRMQVKYLEEAKEKEEIAEQMQAEINKLKTQVVEMEDTHNRQLTELQQQLQEANQGSSEQIQELHNQLSLSQEKAILLKEKITQLESDVESLKDSLKKSKEENEMIMEENYKRQLDIEKLSTKLSATVSAVKSDQEAIGVLTDDLNRRKKEIEVLEGEKKLIMAERDATMKKGKENKKAVNDLRDQYKQITDKLKNEIHELKESNEKEKKAFQDKQGELESNIEALEKHQRESEQKYLQEKERFEEEISNYVATKGELEQELHSMKLEMQEAHKQEIETLQEKIILLESNLQTAATTHNERVKSLNAQLRDLGERENALKEHCKEHQEEITQLSKLLNEQRIHSSTEVQELMEKLEATKAIHAEEVARSEEQFQSALDEATNKHLTEKQSLMDQITELQESNKNYNNEIECLQIERDESKAALAVKDEQIKKLMDDVKKTQEEKLQLEGENRGKDQELQQKEVEFTALQEQLSLQAQKLKEANDHYETERVNFDNQVTSLKEKLSEQAENVEKLSLQLQELKDTHAATVQQVDVTANNTLLEKTQLQADLQTSQEARYALEQQLTESQAREKAILKQSAAEMDSIQEEKAVLETNLRETEAQYSEKIAQLEGQLEETRLENEQLETLSDQMKQQFKENEITYSKEITEMKDEMEKMTTEHQETISRHVAENSMLQKQLTLLQNDVQASNETIDELKHQLQESSVAKDANEKRFNQETSKLTQLTHELQSKIDTLNLQLQQSANVHDELTSAHRANEVKINELSSVKEDTQLNYNMAVKQLSLTRECATHFKEKFESQLTEIMLLCDQRLASLKDQLVLSVENISCLQENIRGQQRIIAEYKKEKAALEQTILTQKMDYENACQQNEVKISNLQEELQHSEEKIITLDNQNKELNELIPKIENDFSIKFEGLQQECDGHIEKIQQLEGENRNLAKQCEQQSTDYNHLMETKDAQLNKQEQEFLSKIETLKEELTRVEDTVSTKQFEIDELKQSLQNISTQAAVMEQKLSSQEAKIPDNDEPDTSEEAIIKVKLANFIQQLKSKLEKFDDRKMSSRTQANLLEATAEKNEIFIETADNAIEISLERLDEIQQHYVEEKKLSEKKCEQLKNELDDLSTRYQQIDEQLQKTQQHYVVEIESLRQQFAVKEQLYTTSSEEKEQLEKECEKLRTEIDELVTKCEELQVQLQNSQQHYTVEIDTLQQQFAMKEKLYESTSKETQSTIDNLKKQEEKLFTKIEVLSTELDTCKASFAEKEKIMDDSINQLESDLQKSEEDRISQEQSNSDIIQHFKEELVKLQTLLEEEQRASSTAQSQLDESITTFTQEKTALQSSIVTLNEQLETSSEEVTHLRRKSLGTESALKQLEVDYRKTKEQYNQLEKQYKTEKDEWTQKLETLQQTNECEQLKNELDDLSTRYQQIDEQLQKTQQHYVVEIESLRQQFAVKEQLYTTSSEEKEQLEKEWTQKLETLQQTNEQLTSLQAQHETQVQELIGKLDTQNATTQQHHQELTRLQSSIAEQMESLRQLRELVDSIYKPFTNDDSLDLTRQINTLKMLCSQRPSTLDELVTQHDKDMDMIEQEHEEEVKALRQEKHSLQQKLQEAELKWNHYITQQAAQIKETMEQTSNSDQLLQTLFIENQQLEQAKAAMSVTIHELTQEKRAYMKIITQLAYTSIPITSVNR